MSVNSLPKDEQARDRTLRRAFHSIEDFHKKGNFEKCKQKAKRITSEINESEVKDFFEEKFKSKMEIFKKYFEE
jgi:hypothetical protein